MSEAPGRRVLPIFPLPTVVLFPGGRVPLHVFEPRYQQLTADVLAGDLRLGLVAVRPEWLDDLSGDPPVFSVGCEGWVQRARKHEDGRYDLLVAATRRFRIVHEPPRPDDRAYRVAAVELLSEQPVATSPSLLHDLREETLVLLEDLRSASRSASEHPDLASLDDATFLNLVCQLLDLPPLEKQGLLEADSILERADSLVGLLRFELAQRRSGASPSGARH